MNPRDLSASSITMRLKLMRELLDDLETAGNPSAEDLREDRLLRRAVERILSQLVDLAADINQHAAAALRESPASEYRETFDLAAQLGLISTELADVLKPSVGMRNVLIHEYANVDLGIVSAAIPRAREQYGSYVRAVAEWLASR